MAEIIQWIDSNGTTYTLTGQPDVDVLFDRDGFYMPEITIAEDTLAMKHGAIIRNKRFEPRDLSFGLIFYGTDQASLRQTARKYLRAFNPLNPSGKIRVTSPDGSTREINCIYTGGLSVPETTSSYGQTFLKTVIKFRAHDPFWYSVDEFSETFTLSNSNATFFPFFPLRLTNTTVFNSSTINYDGDIEGYPVWQVKGPGNGLTIKNQTTGEQFVLTGISIDANHWLTIDVRNKTVTYDDGSNWFSYIAAGSSFWALQPGTNQISIEMPNSTTDSLVVLTYKECYLGV